MSTNFRTKNSSPRLITGLATFGVMFGLMFDQAHGQPASAATSTTTVAFTDGFAGWGEQSSAGHHGRKLRKKGKGKGKRKAAKGTSTIALRTKAKLHKGRRRHHKGNTDELAAAGGPGLGGTDESTCRESLTKAKELMQQSQLVEASELVNKCARPACGKVVEQACTVMQTELQSDTPTVVITTANSGSPASKEIEVTIDGKPLTSKLDGRAIPVNPGNHEFAFTSEGTELGTQTVLIAQGQRNRALTVPVGRGGGKGKAAASEETVAAKSDQADKQENAESEDQQGAEGSGASDAQAGEDGASEAHSRRGHETASSQGGSSSWATYALAGVGVAGLGGAALLTYWGRKDNADLASMCAPDCSADSVHHIRNLYLAADVAAGAGVVALIASTWLAVTSGGQSEKEGRKEVAHLRRIDVRPSATGGAIASIGGSF